MCPQQCKNFSLKKPIKEQKSHFKEIFEAFVVFKKFKAEEESGYVIKALRSFRRDGFTSKELNDFCENNGIGCPITYAP